MSNEIPKCTLSFFALCVFSYIFSRCFLLIYFPYLRDFTPASCSILDSFELYSSETEGGEAHSRYRQLKLSLNIDGEDYIGFGCEATSFHDSTFECDSPQWHFAYSYEECSEWNKNPETECKDKQEVQGRWLCDQYRSESAFEVGEIYHCWWHLSCFSKKPSEISVFEEYPHQESPYLEVIFKPEPWIPKAEYLSLWIVCFGICVCIPLILFVYYGLYLLYHYSICKKLAKAVYYLSRRIPRLCVWFYRLFRKHIFVCFTFYDPYVVVENREALFLHACVNSKTIQLKKILSVTIYSYLENNNE